MLALDDFNGLIYFKPYTLRAVGANIEAWVANDTAFPAGDCRGAASTVVTDAQVQAMVTEFDTVMYPRETAAFSTPPDRDGTNPVPIFGDIGTFPGAGNRTLALIDNVRDDNFFDFPAAPTYIAGFHFSLFNELMDRNVMTIDAYDWAHRTGANPPDEPTDDLCTSRPARPRLYEGTFAHEWQHLLHYYTDPFEGNWVNEGLADFAQTLTGYVDGTRTVFDSGGDSHLYCFQGFGIVQTPFNPNPRDCGGPENSLNLWDEGDPAEVLADYGIAYSLLLFLFDRYGIDLISADAQRRRAAGAGQPRRGAGGRGRSRPLPGAARPPVDGAARRDRRRLAARGDAVHPAQPGDHAEPALHRESGQPGRLRQRRGRTQRGRLRPAAQRQRDRCCAAATCGRCSSGARATLPPLPLEWTLVNDDPDRPGNSVLFSGNDSNLDRTAVTRVTVPAGSPSLTFLAKYGAEAGFDYGYVLGLHRRRGDLHRRSPVT